MNKQPLVSILIPAYNSAEFIMRAIESALGQTYRHIEVVVVDNASTDDTFYIAEKYARQDIRLRACRNVKNIGPVQNWRRCAELAQGEYVGVLFSDDWYEPAFVEKAVTFLEDPQVGFVYSSVRRVLQGERTPNQGYEHILYDLSQEGVLPTRIFLESHLYLTLCDAPLSPGCSLCRLKDLREGLACNIPDPCHVRYMDHGAGHDVFINLLNAMHYPLFAHIREPLVNFFAHDANLSRQPEVPLAYPLAKAYFFEAYAIDLVDRRKFYAAHLWRLLRLKKLHLYHSSFRNRIFWFNIGWGHLVGYLAKRLSAQYHKRPFLWYQQLKKKPFFWYQLRKVRRWLNPRDDFNWNDYPEHYAREYEEIAPHLTVLLSSVEHQVDENGKIIIAEKHDDIHPNHRLIYEFVLKSDVKSVLEVGCGGGFHLANLKTLRPDLICVGLDLNRRQFEFGLSKIPNLAKSMEFFQSDFSREGAAESLNRSFDLVFTQAVVMHIGSRKRRESLLRNMLRVSQAYVLMVENWWSADFVNETKNSLRSVPGWAYGGVSKIESEQGVFGLLAFKRLPVLGIPIKSDRELR